MDKYNFLLDMDSENSVSILAGMIEKNSVVLEIGPAHGRLTKYMKEVLSCTVDIVEIESAAGKDAGQYARTALIGPEGDAEEEFWYKKLGKERYDYVVLADILEHLRQPEKLLLRCKKLLKHGGALLLSVPNLAHTDVILNLFLNKFEYQDLGLLDSTHIHFFTYESLHQMLNNNGLTAVVERATYCPVGYAGLNVSYASVSREFGKELRKKKYGEVYQFIIKAVRKEEAAKRERYLAEFYDGSRYEGKLYVLEKQNKEYSENRSIAYFIRPEQREVTLAFEISGYRDVVQLRLDPINVNCIYQINEIGVWKGEKKTDLRILSRSGEELSDGIWICGDEDPYIICDFPKGCGTLIRVGYTILEYDSPAISVAEKEIGKGYSAYQSALEAKNLELERQQQEMEQYRQREEEITHILQSKDVRIGELDWKVRQLENTIAGLENDRMSLDNTIGSLQEKITELKEQLSFHNSVEGQIRELKEQNSHTARMMKKTEWFNSKG